MARRIGLSLRTACAAFVGLAAPRRGASDRRPDRLTLLQFALAAFHARGAESNACAKARDHEDPDPDVQRDEPQAEAQPLGVDDRLVRELPARLAREEEGLVGLDRGDREAERAESDDQHAAVQPRDQERVRSRDRGAAEELERLEAFDRRVLPRAADRRDPARRAADQEQHGQRQGGGVEIGRQKASSRPTAATPAATVHRRARSSTTFTFSVL